MSASKSVMLVARQISNEFLCNDEVMDNLRDVHAYFPLRPNERGCYIVKGDYLFCKTSLDLLSRRLGVSTATLEEKCTFISSILDVEFVLEPQIPHKHSSDAHIWSQVRKYDPITSVVIDLVITNHTVCNASISFIHYPNITDKSTITEFDALVLFDALRKNGQTTLAMTVCQQSSVSLDKPSLGTITAEQCADLRQTISKICVVCQAQSTSYCGLCSMAYYCTTSCQKTNWRSHREHCTILALFANWLMPGRLSITQDKK